MTVLVVGSKGATKLPEMIPLTGVSTAIKWSIESSTTVDRAAIRPAGSVVMDGFSGLHYGGSHGERRVGSTRCLDRGAEHHQGHRRDHRSQACQPTPSDESLAALSLALLVMRPGVGSAADHPQAARA